MSSPLKSLSGRRVLVTGHTGFKGSWLLLWLEALGARVSGLALAPPTQPSLFELAGAEAPLERSIIQDVRDPAAVARAIADVDPEVIFHLAAQALVLPSYRQPLEAFEVNAQGTANVLDAVRARGRPCVVVVITTDKVYGGPSGAGGYVESDRLGGGDPYSASKACAELICESYRDSFFGAGSEVLLATARSGNVIGGGDWAEHRLVPDVVRSLQAGEPLELRHPEAVRPWQHVLEPLGGYLLLAARLLEGSSELCTGWNFGPRQGQLGTVRDVVERFHQAWGAPSAWEPTEGTPPETSILQLDSGRAQTILGWEQRWDLDEAIARTAAWYRRWAEAPERARQACLDDLAAFEAPP